MRTAISHNERAIVDYHMRAWSAAVAAQDGSVSVISSVMGISHDEALDLCNMCYDGQSMLDHLGGRGLWRACGRHVRRPHAR